MSDSKKDAFDIEKLRIPVAYGATYGVKKLLITVPVARPPRTLFIRTHPDPLMVLPVAIYEDKTNNTTYLISPAIASAFPDIPRRVELYRAIDRQGNQRLIPVPLPGPDGQRNPWHESLLQAIELSKSRWLRIIANVPLGAYEPCVAVGGLADPSWPDTSLAELIQVAFRGLIIDSEDHPVICALQGKV